VDFSSPGEHGDGHRPSGHSSARGEEFAGRVGGAVGAARPRLRVLRVLLVFAAQFPSVVDADEARHDQHAREHAVVLPPEVPYHGRLGLCHGHLQTKHDIFSFFSLFFINDS